jgi:glycosyltransferase involved in cell wall biosynthesis
MTEGEGSSPLISIIIPVYNVEPYLRECLDSVVSQTLREIEIVCVNDCSTDKSLTILQEYAARDKRIIVIDKPVNEGLSTTRNIGMAVASGTFLLFVDSDDILDTELCRKAFNCAEASHADLVLYDYASFVEKRDLDQRVRKESALQGMDPNDKIALLRMKYYAWIKLIKVDLVRLLGLRFPEGFIYEDAPVHWTLVTMTSRIALLPERLYFYRQRAGSIGGCTDWKRTDYIFVFDQVRDFLLQHNLYNKYRHFFLSRELINFNVLYDTIDSSLKCDVLELIHKRLNADHWELIDSGKLLDRRTREFFLAIRGSACAKVSRSLWLAVRRMYRFLRF